ncbi:MAG: enterochelin esterase [Bdellovibrionales bacterium]|nr:enterochelin esterase [Bdellovibrionales bacterium]
MKAEFQKVAPLFRLENFEVSELIIQSEALSRNPLGDSSTRRCPTLIPKNKSESLTVVFVLAGFAGNGVNYFGVRSFENNFPQLIDLKVSQDEAPSAIYVFVDAMTSIGGAQFINSEAVGRYEDYIIEEIVGAVRDHTPAAKDSNQWCVMGGSSGGYGALHLASKYPSVFSLIGAIAPDSYFESVYLKDFYETAETLKSIVSTEKLKQWMESGGLEKRNGFRVLNAAAMTACYSPKSSTDLNYPIDLDTGILKPDVWREWKSKDPVEFLAQREFEWRGAFLEVGLFDEEYLLYGARQIRNILQSKNVKHHYAEFKGGHRDLSDRRPDFLMWLYQALKN